MVSIKWHYLCRCILTLPHRFVSYYEWDISEVEASSWMYQVEKWQGHNTFIWKGANSAVALHLQRWVYSTFRLSSCVSSNKAHFIIMELCHTGLKALVMNNYSMGKEHGRIQNKKGVMGGGATVEKTGVCHELYIWRNASILQMNAFQIVLCLLMFAVTNCVLLGRWIL